MAQRRQQLSLKTAEIMTIYWQKTSAVLTSMFNGHCRLLENRIVKQAHKKILESWEQ